MDLNKISLFNMMTQRMNWLSQRQSLLAGNIANANTPGYKPKDLKELSFKTMLRQSSGSELGVARTNGAHMVGSTGAAGKHKAVEIKSHETTPNGNAVVLEEQLMKSGETRMNYTMTLNLYRKHVDMIKTALGGGR